MALIKEGLWIIVTGTEDAPVTGGDWPKCLLQIGRALASIVLAAEPALLYLVGPDSEDRAMVWKKLADQFQQKNMNK